MQKKTPSKVNIKSKLQLSSEFKAIYRLPYSRLNDGLDDEPIDYPLDEAAPETYTDATARASAMLSDNL